MAPSAPFVAASPGALKNLEVDPRVKALWDKTLAEGEFKDIWGSDYSTFMGIQDGGDVNQIADNPSDYNRAYSADAVVYRCVDIRGAAIASVPFGIYDGTDPDERKPVDHEALDVLKATNPFGYVAGPQLLRYSLSSRDLHGHFAWRLIFDKGGRPREIYWMQPEGYKAVAGADLKPPNPKLPFGGLKVREKQREYIIPPNEVVYAPTHNIRNPLAGMSKITALRNAINLKAMGEASNIWFFQNNQRPDLLVTGAFNPTVENVSLMRRIWNAAFGGDKQRGPAFLPHDMSVHLLTTTPKDAEWLGQQTFSRESILAGFGVPPPVYGDLARATYENIRTAFENFWRTEMISQCDEIAWFITQQFLWKWQDARKAKLVCCFDYSQIEALNEDANAIWERFMAFMQRVTAAVSSRQLTPNQSRILMEMEAKRLGLPAEPWQAKVPGGDMFYVRIQEVPVIEASVQANIDMMAARAGDVEQTTNKPGNGSWKLPSHLNTFTPNPAPGAPGPAGAPGVPGPRGKPGKKPRPAPAAANGHSGQSPRDNSVAQANKAAEPPPQPQPPPPGQPVPSQNPAQPPPQPLPVVVPPPQPLPVGAAAAVPPVPIVVPDPLAIREMRLKAVLEWLVRRFKRYFQDQQTLALRKLRASTAELALVDAPNLWDRDEARQQASQIVKLAAAMAHDVAYQAAAQDFGLQVKWEGPNERVIRYLGSRLHFIQNIDDTTRKAIAQTLAEGVSQAEDLRALQVRVRNVFASAIDHRSLTIARTESVQAYGYGSIQAYREAGVLKARMHDGPNADSADCINVDGQEVTLDEAERLMSEEHPNGVRAVAPVLA